MSGGGYLLIEQIEKNKRKTVLVVAIFLVLYVIIVGAFGYYLTEDIVSGLVIGLVVGLVYASISVMRAKKRVIKLSKGTEIVEKSQSPQIWNIVEEVSLSSGIPMPKIYIIDSYVPNAFAAGMKQEDAIIGVTQGLIDRLDREEMEGVIAHEFAHIQNNDMVLQTVVVSLVASIAFMSSMRFVRRSSKSDSNNNSGVLLLIAIIIMIVGRFVSQLAQLALSRNREYLADATAVDITRNPEGLKRALAKINQAVDTSTEFEEGALGFAPDGREYTQELDDRLGTLFFANPLKAWSSDSKDSVLSTHPNTFNRIAKLDEMM